MLFRGSTLDDALYRVLKSLLVSRRAYSVVSTRKASRELVGALIRMVDSTLIRNTTVVRWLRRLNLSHFTAKWSCPWPQAA